MAYMRVTVATVIRPADVYAFQTACLGGRVELRPVLQNRQGLSASTPLRRAIKRRQRRDTGQLIRDLGWSLGVRNAAQ
jgi:hypothetical protein